MVLLFNDCVGARGDSDINILAGYKKTKKKDNTKRCRKRKLKKCKGKNVEEFVNQRFSELATPRLLLVENTLASYSKTLDPERVVRLVKLIHELHEPRPPMKRLVTKKKRKKRRKCRKLSKEEEKRRWLEKQSSETAKLIICFLKNYVNYTPNYKQLHVSLELAKQLKFKKRKDLSRMTKAELNKICQKLAVICDTKFEPYKRVVKVESIKSETTIAEEDKKHCIFSMKDFEFDFESSEEESEEEEEGEEEEEEEFEEYVDELAKMIEEEVAALAGEEEAEGDDGKGGRSKPATDEGGEAGEFGEAGEAEEFGEAAAEAEADGEGAEDGEEEAEGRQEQIGDVMSDEAGGAGESGEEEVGDFGDGMAAADDKVEETDEEEVEGEVLVDEWDKAVEEAIEELEGEGSVTVSIEEEEEFGVAAEFEGEEGEEEMGEEEMITPEEMAKLEGPRPHPEGTVSFVSWSMYSSWLNEFGKNINMYSSCLQQFRYTLQKGTVAKHHESIRTVLTNWSKYLGDVKTVDQKMVMYFKNKPITRCDKCLEYDMTNIPKDHDIPKELLDAVKTTQTWKKLLSDAEKHCKTIGKVEEPQLEAASASVETIEILDVGSSSSSGFYIEDKD